MTELRLTPAELALADAQKALERKDLTAAVAAFERAVAGGASPRLTARSHALALSDLGRHAEAIDVFRPWFAKNPKDGPIVNLMGVFLKRAGRLTKAVEVLDLARKLRPQDLSAWQNLGNVHEALGNHEKAAACYRGALKIEPKSADLFRLLGGELLALGQVDAAVESLRRAVMLAPGNPGIVAL